jgi:hypothetical protein
MQRTFAMGLGANAVVAAGAWLAIAAMNPQAARAQELWAAVVISPSTLDSSEAHGAVSQSSAENGAFQSCAKIGATDCKVAAVSNQCVGLAISSKVIANQYGYATSPTRDGAAAGALAACAKAGGTGCYATQTPCGGDDPRWDSPLPLPPTPPGPPLTVDRSLVGIWEANVPGGIWLWQIAANGAYTFRSEATDEATSHAGEFTASNGKYQLRAYNIKWDDQGTYTVQPGGNAIVFSGKLGTGTWTRVANNGTSAPSNTPIGGVTIRK